jgi:MarR family transcriptional regulator, organic hydroperoxide resistance regulator
MSVINPSRATAAKTIAPKRTKRAALTISRPEMLVDGSDQQFRRLVHGLFAFFARHSTIREGHGAFIGLAGIEYTTLISIRHLAAAGEVGVRGVAAHLHLSGAFTTTITNKLLAKGLIEKAPHPVDKRRLLLSVTPRGDELLEHLAPMQTQVNNVEFGCLSAKEFQQLLDIVERLVRSSDQAVSLQRYLAETQAKEQVADFAAKRETRRKVKKS